jgi:hypothetical protein
MVKGHENCCSVWTVIWAAQPRVTVKPWLDEPPVAGSDGAVPVDGAAPVDGAGEAAQVAGADDDAWPAAGVEGAYPAGDSGDFAWLLPGPEAAPCGVFDAIAGGIDAVTGVIAASADGMSAATRCWALRLA